MERRIPPKTPGTASTTDAGDSNWMLPMELHRDAAMFYADALAAEQAEEFDRRDQYARAAIVAVFSSLEAQLNLNSAGHAEAHNEKLEPIVLDVLREQETAIDERGRIYTRKRLMPLTARISFLTAFVTGQELDRGGQLWQDLLRAIELRDRCVHPKPPFPFETTLADAAHAINTVGAVFREISRLGDFQPQNWWADIEDLLEGLPSGSTRRGRRVPPGSSGGSESAAATEDAASSDIEA